MVNVPQSYQERVSQMISWGHWFALFNILLILPIGTHYLFVSDWPRTLAGRLYAMLSVLGHFSFLGFALYLLLLFPLTFIINSQRLLRLFATIIATIAITLLLIDSQIFEQFRLHLNFMVWDLITNPENAELSRKWQLLFICVPLIFLAEILFANWIWLKQRSLIKRERYARPFYILFILSFFASHFIHIWADANFYRPITMQRSNLPLSYPMTARSFLEKHGLFDRQAYLSKKNQEGDPDAVAINYPLKRINFTDQGSGYNLLMIVIDSVHYPSLVGDMPNVAKFADNNLRFTQHISSGNDTTSSLVGLFYGISPTYLNGILADRMPSVLTDSIKQQGYQCAMFSTDGFASPLYRQALWTDMSLNREKLSNQEIVKRWLTWQERRDKETPWFNYISFANSNAHNTQMNSQRIKTYQHSISDVDKQIGIILNKLQEQQRLANTIVIITANYGQSFYDNQQNNFSRAKLTVPLFIHWPGKEHHSYDYLTSHNDIMTTLMQDLLHVKNNATEYSQGNNLFNDNRRYNWVLSGQANKLAITTPTETIILKGNGNYSVYDLQYQLQKQQKISLELLLQVLTEMKRFIAD